MAVNGSVQGPSGQWAVAMHCWRVSVLWRSVLNGRFYCLLQSNPFVSILLSVPLVAWSLAQSHAQAAASHGRLGRYAGG